MPFDTEEFPVIQKFLHSLARLWPHSETHRHLGSGSSFTPGLGWVCLPVAGNPLDFTMRGHACAVNCVAIVPNKSTALSGTHDGKLLLWDLPSGSLVSEFEHHTAISCITCTDDSKSAAVGLSDGKIVFWDLRNGQRISETHHHAVEVSQIEYFGAGGLLTAAMDGSIRITGLSNSKTLTLTSKGGSVLCTHVCEDAHFFLTGSRNGLVEKWDLRTGKVLLSIETGPSPVYAVRATPDSESLFVATETAVISKYNSKTGEQLATYNEFNEFFISVEISSDASFALASFPDGALAKIDLESGEPISGFWGESFNECIALSDDGCVAVTGTKDNTVVRWDVTRPINPVQFRGHASVVSHIAVAATRPTIEANGEGLVAVTVASDSPRAVNVLDLDTGESRGTYDHSGDMFVLFVYACKH